MMARRLQSLVLGLAVVVVTVMMPGGVATANASPSAAPRTTPQRVTHVASSPRLATTRPAAILPAPAAMTSCPGEYTKTDRYQFGFSPMQVREAYGIPASATGAGITIAIVIGYHDPTACQDFDVFSKQFGLPTIAGGCNCFTQVNQYGQTSNYPSVTGNPVETSMDIEWAHAIAPAAHILLVESNSIPPGKCAENPHVLDNIFTAEDYATAHAQVVSNSWNCDEFPSETSDDVHFNKPVAITVAAGDKGSPALYPSTSPYVLSVGGTSLSINGRTKDGGCVSGGCTWGAETVWNDIRGAGGGGLSQYETMPDYQLGYCGTTVNVNSCTGDKGKVMRGTPDVSWMADCYVTDPKCGLGAAIYDSALSGPKKGWGTDGGTSLGAPSVAGLIALADQMDSTVLTTNDLTHRFTYQAAASSSNYGTAYHDIWVGSTGSPCCSATRGYDLASGLGRPNAAAWIQAVAPPPPVTSVTITAITTSSLTLNWTNPSSSNYAGVMIRRALGSIPPATPSDGAYVADVVAPLSTYTDTGLNAGTTYSYALFAHDSAYTYAQPATGTGITSPIPPSTSSGWLQAVTAVSANDVWAVGAISYSTTPNSQTLIEHWDGSAWRIIASPSPGRCSASFCGNSLNGIVSLSANDVWAVGEYSTQSVDSGLIEHWDGKVWSVVTSPTVGVSASLNAVVAVSANDIWAVGYYVDPVTGIIQTLTEHWDGNSWSVVPSPSVVWTGPGAGTNDNILYSVTAVSSSDVWAVGAVGTSAASQTVIEHWDGLMWSVVPSPNQYIVSFLQGVSAVSASDVWAVGVTTTGFGQSELVEHWDGSAWTIVPSLNYPVGDSQLNAVTALSSSDVWAMGGSESFQTVVEHFDGNSWSGVPSPNAVSSNYNYLSGVAAVSASDVWAVGAVNGSPGSVQSLIEHWDGSTWSIVPSP